MDCSCRGRNLDKMLQPGILLCVKDRKKYGYQIIEELGQSPMFDGVSPDKTGVYRYLKRMEDSGYLISEMHAEDAKDALRKRYAISQKGLACLASWGSTLREYVYALSQLVEEIENIEIEDTGIGEKEMGTVETKEQKEKEVKTDLYLITGFLGQGRVRF